MAVNGTSTLRSLPRICRTAVSRRTFAVEVLPLNVTGHVASAPISLFAGTTFRASLSHCKQLAAFRDRKPLDGIAYGGSRNSRTVGAQIRLEPRRIGFACLAEHPAYRFLQQIFPIGVKPARDL